MPADLADALAALPPPRALLDVGTGLGTVAIHAAERGYRVVATDVAARALSRAALRAAHLTITFVRDDVRATRVVSAFDVVVDRGCMHALVGAARAAYAASISRLVRPGGALLLVSDAAAARSDRATSRLGPTEIALELPLFDLERAAPTTLDEGDPGTAWLSVWRRRSPVIERLAQTGTDHDRSRSPITANAAGSPSPRFDHDVDAASPRGLRPGDRGRARWAADGDEAPRLHASLDEPIDHGPRAAGAEAWSRRVVRATLDANSGERGVGPDCAGDLEERALRTRRRGEGRRAVFELGRSEVEVRARAEGSRGAS